MAGRYVPSLAVHEAVEVTRERRLPIDGQVLCAPGDEVGPEDVLARAQLPGEIVPFNIARALGVPPSDLERYMKVRTGAAVTAGQILAERKGLLEVFRPGRFVRYIVVVRGVTGNNVRSGFRSIQHLYPRLGKHSQFRAHSRSPARDDDVIGRFERLQE